MTSCVLESTVDLPAELDLLRIDDMLAGAVAVGRASWMNPEAQPQSMSGAVSQDTLRGGVGPDLFVLHARPGRDVVVGFNPVHDALDLSAAHMPGVMPRLTDTIFGAQVDLGPVHLLLRGVIVGRLRPEDFINDL